MDQLVIYYEEIVKPFAFVNGVTPLSDWNVLIVAPIYFALIYATKAAVSLLPKPFDLNWLVIVHNWLLVVLSAILFVALGYELVVQFSIHGFWQVFCDPEPTPLLTHGPLVFYYYINYLYKYIELFDTVLLALRGKPTPFLHTYHHAATLILCWSQLRAQSCVQWVPIIINLGVHVIMYSYYALHAMGISVWWKRYLTLLQIIQFVVGLIGCVGGLGPRSLHDLGFTQFPKCHGEYEAAAFGIGVLLTYLFLFIDLYKKSYGEKQKRRQAAKQQTVTNGNGHVAHKPDLTTTSITKKDE